MGNDWPPRHHPQRAAYPPEYDQPDGIEPEERAAYVKACKKLGEVIRQLQLELKVEKLDHENTKRKVGYIPARLRKLMLFAERVAK